MEGVPVALCLWGEPDRPAPVPCNPLFLSRMVVRSGNVPPGCSSPSWKHLSLPARRSPRHAAPAPALWWVSCLLSHFSSLTHLKVVGLLFGWQMGKVIIFCWVSLTESARDVVSQVSELMQTVVDICMAQSTKNSFHLPAKATLM